MLHELTQFMVSKVIKLLLGDDAEFPHLGEDYQGVSGALPPPLEGGDLGFEGSPPTARTYTLIWVSEGATALMAMASSGNSMSPQWLHT